MLIFRKKLLIGTAAVFLGAFNCTLVAAAFDMRAIQNKSIALSGEDSSPEAAQRILQAFLAPGANYAELTAQLRPAPEDYAVVYKEPLAEKIAAAHAGLWASGAAIAPKRGQSELLMVYATTDQLIAGQPVLKQFPGGYDQVRQYLNPGVPIVRFKFVKPGETLGMAFDGLVHVNGRWVLMPKPWRAMR